MRHAVLLARRCGQPYISTRNGSGLAVGQSCSETPMDVLSDVLRAVRLTGAVYFDMDAGAPFVGESPGTAAIAASVMPGAEHVISFHAVISGSCWAALGDGALPPVELKAGDIVVFPAGDANVMSSHPGLRGDVNMAMYYRPVEESLPFAVVHGGTGDERTRFICGYFGCDAHPFNPLLSALPRMMCARNAGDGGSWVTDLFQLAMTEGASRRAGGETILAKLSELMFVGVVRNHLASLPDDAKGWIAGLRDAHVGGALQIIHGQPKEDWTLDRLARGVGMSRTAFATRFADLVGCPPMQYLTRWRLQLAARLLELPDVSVAQAAAEVGYESEAAFNRAFKNFTGVPPGAWRKRRSGLLTQGFAK
jgi:AraC-like DNA-binding protein